ncbi:MAG: RDD family protein [Nocardioides sp.]
MSDQFPPAPGSPEPPSNPYGAPEPASGAGVPASDAPGQYSAPNPYGAPAPADAYGITPQQGYGLGYQDVPVYASWAKRVSAYFVDSVAMFVAGIPAFIGYVLYSVGAADTAVTDPTTGKTELTEPMTGGQIGLITLGYALMFGFWIWNFLIRQGKTGQTIGKSALGITLIGDQTRQPIGAGRNFLRQLAHFVDQILCYIGYLWPLWDAKRQTFADKIMNTIVVEKN